ncbi:hypothetical protein KY285_016754 [Solanum tuberosum]|nr:hypothetical protein KY285_016754 [Solanum tuberosum]
MDDLKRQFTSTAANRRPVRSSGVRERERRHWSVERRTRWVRVQDHGGEERWRQVRERVYAISSAKMATTATMASPVDVGREQ